MFLSSCNIIVGYQSLPTLSFRKSLINTINAWSYVVAQEDEEFAEALRGGDVLIPDGGSLSCGRMGSWIR